MEGRDNAYLAGYFGVPVQEIHAKRSQWGITIPKIAALKDAEKVDEPYHEPQPLEQFVNGDERCVVLARKGNTALIARLDIAGDPFVVPLEHTPGATNWWQGKYFETLAAAWKYYEEAIK